MNFLDIAAEESDDDNGGGYGSDIEALDDPRHAKGYATGDGFVVDDSESEMLLAAEAQAAAAREAAKQDRQFEKRVSQKELEGELRELAEDAGVAIALPRKRIKGRMLGRHQAASRSLEEEAAVLDAEYQRVMEARAAAAAAATTEQQHQRRVHSAAAAAAAAGRNRAPPPRPRMKGWLTARNQVGQQQRRQYERQSQQGRRRQREEVWREARRKSVAASAKRVTQMPKISKKTRAVSGSGEDPRTTTRTRRPKRPWTATTHRPTQPRECDGRRRKPVAVDLFC
jgi:hypothetical protein